MTTRAPHVLAIEIRPEDIRAGKRLDCERCPVALALLRTLDAESVFVSPLTVYVGRKDGTGVDYDPSAPLVEWLCRFDHSESVVPGRFMLNERIG